MEHTYCIGLLVVFLSREVLNFQLVRSFALWLVLFTSSLRNICNPWGGRVFFSKLWCFTFHIKICNPLGTDFSLRYEVEAKIDFCVCADGHPINWEPFVETIIFSSLYFSILFVIAKGLSACKSYRTVLNQWDTEFWHLPTILAIHPEEILFQFVREQLVSPPINNVYWFSLWTRLWAGLWEHNLLLPVPINSTHSPFILLSLSQAPWPWKS